VPVRLSVLKYGAKCDGTTNDSTAFTNAIAAIGASGAIVSMPAGTCIVNSTLTIPNHTQLVGAGPLLTRLSTSSASLVQIQFNADVILRDFGLIRSVTATTGGDGIQGCLSTRCNQPQIDNVSITGGYIGLHIGPTSFGRLSNLQIQNSVSHGLLMQGLATTSGNQFQWELDNVLSELNGGDGFDVLATSGGGHGTMSPWKRPYTYANAMYAIAFHGGPGYAINDIQIIDAFLSTDTNGGIMFDTYGNFNRVADSGVELPDVGINITANNTDTQLIGLNINSCSTQGIIDGGSGTLVENTVLNSDNVGYVNIAGADHGQLHGDSIHDNAVDGVLLNVSSVLCLSGNMLYANGTNVSGTVGACTD
jgi:hypothetical protein